MNAAFFGYRVDWAAFVVAYLIGPLVGGVCEVVAYTSMAGLPRPAKRT